MVYILLAHALAALLAFPLIRTLGRNAFYLLALVPAASLGWVIPRLGQTHTASIAWAPSLSMNIDLRFDGLAGVLSVIILGVGALVLAYCGRYFEEDEVRLAAFAAKLTAFAGAMFGVVVSDNMLVMFTFWEATTILSFLLVGHYAEKASSRRAATQALLVTTLGGLAMLIGIVILGESTHSYLLSDVVAAGQAGRLGGAGVTTAILLVVVGALSKSAIAPLHFWLPGAMAAPTPVSAYLHAAAMVKAGIYLIARFAPGFADTPLWQLTIIGLGLFSMLMAGWRSLREYDLKLILAFGTVSQLGLLVTLVSIGSPNTMLAGLTMVVAHSLFKATLFMVTGIIDHTTGTRDVRKLSGLGKRQPLLLTVAALAAASMAGFPIFLGFVGKESALGAVLSEPRLAGTPGIAVAVGIALGSVLTVAYSLRFVSGAFRTKASAVSNARGLSPAVEKMHAVSPAFLFPPAVLAVAGLVGGIANHGVERLVAPYARSLPGHLDQHLALWHGWTLPLGITALVIAGGVGIYVAQRSVERLQFDHPPLGNADRIYDLVLRIADSTSVKLTAWTQRGSLPATQGIIFLTFILVSMGFLLAGERDGLVFTVWDSPEQLVVAVPTALAALSTLLIKNRLSAVIIVGFAGYGIGVIFVLYGAPDLALTQFLVETLTLVIFVLVLRKFPADNPPARGYQRSRVILSLGVGLAASVVAAYAVNARRHQSVGELIPELAARIGHGDNAVNVLLVDIRAWDTLGEISVLLVAATGVASLVFRNRRFGRVPRLAEAKQIRESLGLELPRPDVNSAFARQSPVHWLRANVALDPRHRSLVLEVATRVIFPTMMVLSVYFFFSGHNAPGGGFSGGLVAGLALVLRYLAGGRYELGEALPIDAGRILGLGLLSAAGTALFSLFLGAPPLSSSYFAFHDVPLLGDVSFSTALFFDLGVYLIVVGLVLDVLRSLGARLEIIELVEGTDVDDDIDDRVEVRS